MADRAESIQHVNINVNTSGTNPLVPGVAGMDVVIINYVLIVFGAVDVTFEDETVGTDRIGPLPFAANGGISAPDANNGWQRTAEGLGLNIRLSANVRVGGSLTYRRVPHHFQF